MANPKKKTSLSKRRKRKINNKNKFLLPLLYYNKNQSFTQVYHNVKIVKKNNKIVYYYKNKKITVYR